MTDYKKYSLENLEKWLQDAISCSEATSQEIYDVIKNVVGEEYEIYKNHASRCNELLTLLNGHSSFSFINDNNSTDSWTKEEVLRERDYYESNNSVIDFTNLGATDTITFSAFNSNDTSPECMNSWNSCWNDQYQTPKDAFNNLEYSKVGDFTVYNNCSKETVDDDMRPWGHSDLEYGLSNSVLTEDRISNFPGEQYSEEELNAMCDKAASEQEKEKCREYNLREAEYYDKRAKLDGNPRPYQDYIGWQNLTSNDFDKIFPIPKMDKVAKWVLPVEVDGLTGDCVVTFPDDLLERVGWVEGDTVEFLSNPSGSFTVKKVVKPEVENI